MTLENILRNSSLFHNLSDLDLQHLVPICKRVDIGGGDGHPPRGRAR